MLIKNLWKQCLLLFTITILGSFVFHGFANGAPYQNVELNYFRGKGAENGVLLEWQTASELDTAGFKLKRGQNGSFSYLPDPGGSGDLYIPATGTDFTGVTYKFTDATAVSGETYTYILVGLNSEATELDLAEVTVKAGLQSLYLPMILRP